MALKMRDNGTYEVKTKKQAIEALQAMRRLDAEIQREMEESGIGEMMQDATEMKKAVTRWMTDSEIEQLQCDGFHGTLVRAVNSKMWITTDEDLVTAGQPAKAMSLRRIIRKKFKNAAKRKEVWMRITKRVVDPEALDEAVAEGVLSADEVAPAYVETFKAPYMRVYNDEG